MDRSRALEELSLRIENENIIKHSLAVEAIMRKLAAHFNEDDNLWGITGLVHDIDYERIEGKMELHGKMGGDILEGLDADETIVYAVRAHNPMNGLPRRRKIDKALYCADPMAGLIIACALILPEKKLKNVDTKFILNRFNDKGFARGANREQIASCSELGLTLEEFASISLEALKEISDQLGL
ncbi:MAG TPA: HDIG domain-containing protein [Clostridiaceae bacterium]|nr:HDIG domain-containing protein [Clostridiaceae bacterium]